MTARDDNIGWFCELLEPLGRVTIRRMFGGAGLYIDGLIVALEIDGTLYLKTDERTRQTFADAGGTPFVYRGKDKPVTPRYCTPPDDAMDSPDAMRPWARLALEASLRSAASRKPVKRQGRKAFDGR
jgi:DNA transformation protein and related proteins